MDDFRRKYAEAKQRRLALMDKPAPSDEVRSMTCPWCHAYGAHVVTTLARGSSGLACVERKCQLCGRSTSRLEDR